MWIGIAGNPVAARNFRDLNEESPMKKIISAYLWALLVATAVPALAQ